MNTYETTLKVSKKHLDDLNHVNNVHYVQWVQNIAKAHWQKNAPEAIQSKYFWVLITHFIEHKAEALLNDLIQVKTYISKNEGVTCVRIVEIFNKTTNKLLAKSETKWCFITSKTKRPTRITQEIKNLFSISS